MLTASEILTMLNMFAAVAGIVDVALLCSKALVDLRGKRQKDSRSGKVKLTHMFAGLDSNFIAEYRMSKAAFRLLVARLEQHENPRNRYDLPTRVAVTLHWLLHVAQKLIVQVIDDRIPHMVERRLLQYVSLSASVDVVEINLREKR